MFTSPREITLLFAGLAVAGFLMAAGIVVAVDRLMSAGMPVTVDAALER
jgi:hypothetical protein